MAGSQSKAPTEPFVHAVASRTAVVAGKAAAGDARAAITHRIPALLRNIVEVGWWIARL